MANTQFSLPSSLHQKERSLFKLLDHDSIFTPRESPEEIKKDIYLFLSNHTETNKVQNKEWNTLLRIGWMIIIILSDENTGLDLIL